MVLIEELEILMLFFFFDGRTLWRNKLSVISCFILLVLVEPPVRAPELLKTLFPMIISSIFSVFLRREKLITKLTTNEE